MSWGRRIFVVLLLLFFLLLLITNPVGAADATRAVFSAIGAAFSAVVTYITNL
jgi:hypothetical protein